MCLELFNIVPSGAIEALLDAENQPWFKRAHVGKYLDIKHIHTSLEGLDSAESRSRSAFGPRCRTMASWSGPKGEQNKTDVFLSVYGVMHVIVNSKKSKGKALKEWVMNDVVPRGLNQVIAEKQGIIEDQGTQLALLNDDLTESEDLVRQLEYNNTGLQGEIRAKVEELAVLRQRYVPILEDDRKNYGMTIITKNNESAEYPFISICGQHGYRKQKKKMVLLKNPGSTEFADGDTPNAIVTYNMWREHGLIETDPRKPRDFRLVNIAENQLFLLRD